MSSDVTHDNQNSTSEYQSGNSRSALLGHRVKAYEEQIYFAFRVLVGLLFVQHGAQKLFGLFGGIDGSGSTAPLISMYGAAGIIELVGGLLIVVGLLTRLVALIAAGQMVVAQFIAHLPEGIVPIQNGGELGLLYLAGFLVLVLYGSGRYSLERLFFDREVI
ncbi:DoxX family protein (plasmid) [Haloterrigena turkmenica DSM 5511]|uniref:DoxX family protein n=1 Tax=Haloterrigena turkmenica (strain ATCC 51198 / DSM 5511 / JCM 9101 / NCIMB 13204 / VKM B-1734 / 4k) TaxID=543526 RepID=D2S2I2_HALTV|nr:DoxX family protein [Haloterrigena turkmenica]ADB63579.1 DoxX family protein [Haloterrigena turkmenica DSM 5511]